MPTNGRIQQGFIALGALALVSCTGSSAMAQKTRQSLLGVRLYDSFQTVLKKYGPPQEVRTGGEPAAPNTPETANRGLAATGGAGGGGGKLGGAGGGGMSGAGGMMGMMTGRGMAGMSGGAPGAGGPPSNIMAMMGGMRGGGMPGMSGMGGGNPMAPGGGGLPGFSGRRGGDDEGGAPAMPGAMTGGAGTNAQQEEQDPGEAFWWYTVKRVDPKNKDRQVVHYMGFLFNNEGKVIQIQEYGFAGGQATTKGVGLGDPFNRLLRIYGWSNDGEREGDKMVFRYGTKEKLAFQLYKNQVVGITLAAVK
jgi:hypothetical protein